MDENETVESTEGAEVQATPAPTEVTPAGSTEEVGTE